MLILARKEEESIIIDENIEITVLSIADGKVKIGINAPKEVQIVRSEVKRDIENENKSAIMNIIGLKNLKKK